MPAPPPPPGSAPRPSARDVVARWCPLGALTVSVLVIVWPLLRQTPLSHDHPTHLFKAWHFWTQMLAEGRLSGFTHYWGIGSPWGENVPSGSEAWVALFRLLTFGQLSWTRTYALAVAGVLALSSYAGYAFVSRYFGRGAGAIMGLLLLLDPGGWAQGGWHWTMDWGVWPVTLAMAFVMLSLSRLELVVERGRARDFAIAAAFIGAALLTHHLPIIVYAVALPLFVADHVLRKPPSPAGSWLRIGVATALGVALSACFTLPMLARSAFSRDLGVRGPGLSEVIARLATFETFRNVSPMLLAFAVAGALFGARTRARGTIFFVSSITVNLLLSSDFLVATLHLERVLPSIVKLESLRMVMIAKMFVFGLAAHGLFATARLPLRLPAAARLGALAQRGLLALLLASALAWTVFAPHPRVPERRVLTEQDHPAWADLRAFFEWSAALPRPPGQFFRVCYLFDYHEHIAMLAPVFNGIPLFKGGYTPVQTFRHTPETMDPEVLRVANVKYVLSDRTLPEKEFVLERRFGALKFYRYTRYEPDPFTLTGPGRATLLEFSPERVRVKLEGTAPESRLELHVAYYDRWQATLAGRPLPIAPAPIVGHEFPFLMEVPARDGELVFEYVRRRIDWLGTGASLAALCALGLLVRRDRGPRPLSFALLERHSRTLLRLGFAGAVASMIAYLVLVRTRARMLPQASLFHRLTPGAMTLGGQPCTPREALVFSCGKFLVSANVMVGRYAAHVCMNVEEGAPRRLTVRTNERAPFLSVLYEPRRNVTPGTVRVRAGAHQFPPALARSLLAGPNVLLFDLRPYTRSGHSELELEIELEGSMLHCFDLLSTWEWQP